MSRELEAGGHRSGAKMPDDAAGFIQTGGQTGGHTVRQTVRQTGGQTGGQGANWQGGVMPPPEPVGPATVMAVLRALATMARISRRHEADVGSALHGSGLRLDPEQRDSALLQLKQAECIERVIPLTDGGILVSVTAAGLSRAAAS